MNIEEAKLNIGAEVELLEHTKPYMKNQSESIANVGSNNKPSKLIISKVTDGIVTVVSPENHLYNLNPEHIAFKKVIKHLDIQSVVLGDGGPLTDKIKKLALDAGFKLKEQKNGTMDLNEYVYKFAKNLLNEATEEQETLKDTPPALGEIEPLHRIVNTPLHEWNIDDALYANNHGQEVEVFNINEWVSLDEIAVGHARSRTQFRIKPKKVFIKADDYSKQELLEIIADNFK